MRRGGARGWISAAIWAVAAAVAGVLWLRASPVRDGIPALVDATPHLIGPVEAGRLSAVLVAPGDEVSAGQVVAQLDTIDLDTEIEVQRALVDEFLAEIEAATATWSEEVRERRLSTAADLARVRAALASVRGEQAARQAELQVLAGQIARLDTALTDRLTFADRVGELRARHDSLTHESRHAPEAMRAWSELAQQVQDALAEVRDDELSKRVAPIRARVEGQSRRVVQLLALRERRTLRSPVEGRVTAVLRSTGDSVAAAEPVLRIVPRDAERMTAFAPEDHARLLEVGMEVEAVLRDRTAAQTARGVVERLGPEIVLLPEQLWLAPGQPRYGRPVHIRLIAAEGLLPGEAAYVHARARGGARAAPSPPRRPTPVVVPAALRARTRLEPSGAVWVPELDRLLVVSDDTGRTPDDEHVPIVFTADADGRFDPEPLVIEGVDRISDLEAVVRAPDRRFYLVTSQSQSRKGKRPEKRQWLLRARLEGRKLVVDGRLALYDALERGLSAAARAELGIGAALDIEGAAWKDGALLLGLKAPSDRAGRAVVWRVADVDGLLDRGGLPSEGADAVVSRFLEVALPTGAAGAPGGISDLYLEGDRLYLVSTLADGPAAGAAWRIDLGAPEQTPERLARWEGVKPEVITRAGDGRLVVLFDGGDGQPSRVDHLQEP